MPLYRLTLISYKGGHKTRRSRPSWDTSAIFLTDDDLDFISGAA